MKPSSLLWLSPLALLLSCGRPLPISEDGYAANPDDLTGEVPSGEGDAEAREDARTPRERDDGGDDDDDDRERDDDRDRDDDRGRDDDGDRDDDTPLPELDRDQLLMCAGICEPRVAAFVQTCLREGGDERGCLQRALFVASECVQECVDEQGSSCEQGCEADAGQVFGLCLNAGRRREECHAISDRVRSACVARTCR